MTQCLDIKYLVSIILFVFFSLNNSLKAQELLSPERKEINLYSEILKENRTIIINLPDDYNSSPKRYPVLFVLDAEDQKRYNLSLAGYNYFNGVRHLPKMIIAGIHNTNRTRDISPYIIEQRESSGGGEKFLSFITNELIPYIDSNYRSTEYKIIFGASSAGTFGLYALYSKSSFFNAVIASRPAVNTTPEITWNNEIFFEKMNEFLVKQKCAGKSIYIDYGGQEDDYHDPSSIHRLNELITGSPHQNCRTKFKKIEESGYRSAESLLNGLLWVFNEWYYPADSLYVNGFDGLEIHANNLSVVYDYNINAADLLSENELIMFGYRFIEKNNIEEAIRILENAAEVYSNSWSAFNSLAEALIYAGRISEAISNYKKSLELNPENKNAVEQLKLLKSSN